MIRVRLTLDRLKELRDVMKEEKRSWTLDSQSGFAVSTDTIHKAVRAGPHSFTRYPFKTYGEAEEFIELKCLAAALKKFGVRCPELLGEE